jgi:tetratricopeptide (TPR) repeat protein
VTALALYGLGGITYKQGDFARARMLLQEKLTLERELGDKTNMGFTLLGLAFAAHGQDNDKEAEARIADALAVFREVEHKQGIAKSLYLRGILAHCLGNSQQAIACFAESLTLAREIGSLLITSTCLVGIATVEAEHQTDMLRVARLLAASERLRHESGSFSEPIDAANYQRTIAAVRSSIDDPTFRIAWHEGQAMSVEQAVAFALAASG